MDTPSFCTGTAQLKSIFPHVPELVLDSTLAAHEFNVELAAAALVATLEQPSPDPDDIHAEAPGSPTSNERSEDASTTTSNERSDPAPAVQAEPVDWIAAVGNTLSSLFGPAQHAGMHDGPDESHLTPDEPIDDPAHIPRAWAPCIEPPIECISSEQWSPPMEAFCASSDNITSRSAASVSSADLSAAPTVGHHKFTGRKIDSYGFAADAVPLREALV